MTQLPKLSVNILNYNGPRWLPARLSNVSETHYPSLDVYLAENGNADGLVEHLRNNILGAIVVPNKKNLSFTERYFIRGSFSCVS